MVKWGGSAVPTRAVGGRSLRAEKTQKPHSLTHESRVTSLETLVEALHITYHVRIALECGHATRVLSCR
jgi:hypothetical protein